MLEHNRICPDIVQVLLLRILCKEKTLPLPRFYQILSLKKEKKKNFIRGLSKHTASLHRGFQSLEVTAGDFCGVASTPAAGRGWGCVKEHKYP